MNKKAFAKNIIDWYKNFGRKNLPWQKNKTPYRIWVSEIMLQQSRVKTVIPYFTRFIEHFPTVYHVANASIDEILYLWSGLGYYNRARNLHKTAKIIVNDFRGEFPKNINQMKELPGIGLSTAGAILSFSFQQKYPILDGNVIRILTRYFFSHSILLQSKKKLWELIKNLIPKEEVEKFNQGIMDIGSSICTYKKPKCEICPLNLNCSFYKKEEWKTLSLIKTKKNVPEKNMWCLLLQKENEIWLKRKENGFWKDLFFFPHFFYEKEVFDWIAQLSKVVKIQYQFLEESFHIFSHFRLKIFPIHINFDKKDYMSKLSMNIDNGIWYDTKNPSLIGLPTPVMNILKKINIHLNTLKYEKKNFL